MKIGECSANARVLDKIGCSNSSRLAHCFFFFSLKHIAFVDLGIPSLDAEWVPGHHEDLGMTDVSNSTDSLKLVSDGKIHKMLKLPGVGSSSVNPSVCKRPSLCGGPVDKLLIPAFNKRFR